MKDEIIEFSVDGLHINFDGVKGAEKPGTSITKKARIFYAGTHKGRKYEGDDLKKMSENFPPDGAPIQLDHSTSAKDTVGRLKAVEMQGDALIGTLEFKGKENVERVEDGRWNKLSVGLKIKHPAMAIQELSVTPFPALEKAEILHSADSASKNEEKKEGKEEMSDSKKATGGDGKEKTVNMTDLEAMKLEFAEMKKKNDALEKQIRFKEDREIIENFVREGRTTPAMREKELEMFHSMDEELREKFMEYKQTQPLFIDFRVHNTAQAFKDGQADEVQATKESEGILQYSKFNPKPAK